MVATCCMVATMPSVQAALLAKARLVFGIAQFPATMAGRSRRCSAHHLLCNPAQSSDGPAPGSVDSPENAKYRVATRAPRTNRALKYLRRAARNLYHSMAKAALISHLPTITPIDWEPRPVWHQALG